MSILAVSPSGTAWSIHRDILCAILYTIHRDISCAHYVIDVEAQSAMADTRTHSVLVGADKSVKTQRHPGPNWSPEAPGESFSVSVFVIYDINGSRSSRALGPNLALNGQPLEHQFHPDP